MIQPPAYGYGYFKRTYLKSTHMATSSMEQRSWCIKNPIISCSAYISSLDPAPVWHLPPTEQPPPAHMALCREAPQRTHFIIAHCCYIFLPKPPFAGPWADASIPGDSVAQRSRGRTRARLARDGTPDLVIYLLGLGSWARHIEH